MKILSLIPRIMAVEPAVNWSGTKCQMTLFIYPFQEDFETLCLYVAEKHEPDLILMYAFGEGPYCPDPEKIKRIKDKFPIVYMASDGACRGLWPALTRFRQADCFSAMVNIDGSYNWPDGLIDLVTLSPLDQARYNIYRKPLRDRGIRLGFQGGEGAVGTPRRDICDELERRGILTRGQRNETWGSNQAYTDFMLECRGVVNFPHTGLGHVHVKARVLEAGLAGALILEHSDSILRNYFKKDEEYFEWTTIEDIEKILDIPIQHRQDVAYRGRNKALEYTNPDVWVEKVMKVIQ